MTGPRVRWTATLLLLAAAPAFLGAYEDFLLTQALVLAVAVLSVVVLHRATGAVSLCQATFVGFGAYLTAWACGPLGLSLPLGAAVAVLVTALVATVLAVPAMRLRGMELSVLTLAVALGAVSVVFGTQAPLRVSASGATLADVDLFGLDLYSPVVLYLVVLAVAAAAFAVTALVLHGRTGRRWTASRHDLAAAASVGLRIPLLKAAGFALAAGLAALSGALLLLVQRTTDDGSFSVGQSLLLVVVATLGGIDRVSSAVAGGAVVALAVPVADAVGVDVNWLNGTLGFLVVLGVIRSEQRGRKAVHDAA